MTRDRIDALAEELFAAARAERPDRELVARVERATAPNAPAAAGSGEHPRMRRPSLVRSLLAAIVCGGVLALLLLPRSQDAVIISAERSPGGPAAKPGTPLPSAAAPEDAERSLPRAAAPPAPEGPAPETLSPETDASRAGSAPRSKGANAPARPRALPAPAARPDIPQAAPAGDPAPTPTLSDELGALKQIRQQLRDGDGGAALALLDRYDAGEYGSRLALEARVLRLEALDAVGRRTEAEVLARRFVRDNPDSPLAERAQRFIDRTEPARPAPRAQP